jgi:hypothetical protein
MVLVKRIPTAQEIGKDIILKEKEKEKVVISSRIDKGRKRSGKHALSFYSFIPLRLVLSTRRKRGRARWF